MYIWTIWVTNNHVTSPSGFSITTEIIDANRSMFPRLHNTYSYMSIKVQQGKKDAKIKLQ